MCLSQRSSPIPNLLTRKKVSFCEIFFFLASRCTCPGWMHGYSLYRIYCFHVWLTQRFLLNKPAGGGGRTRRNPKILFNRSWTCLSTTLRAGKKINCVINFVVFVELVRMWPRKQQFCRETMGVSMLTDVCRGNLCILPL